MQKALNITHLSYHIIVPADLFTSRLRPYPEPKVSEGPSLSLSSPTEHESGAQERTSHPRPIVFASQLAVATLQARDEGGGGGRG